MEKESKIIQAPQLKYRNIDGLRSIAAILIICFHIRGDIGFEMTGNPVTNYLINGFIGESWTLVYLFFIISGFSMCCGYYEKVKNNEINLNDFFCKRYIRILPFFALLVLMFLASELFFEGGIKPASIYESFANITLLFGLFSSGRIAVIDAGWTLGVIFGFYILFPFFVFLIWDKKRAWISFSVLTIITYLCAFYFTVDGKIDNCSTIRCLCYFLAGGLIYLYRNYIRYKYTMLGEKSSKRIQLLLVILGFVLVTFKIPFVTENIMVTSLIELVISLLGHSSILIGAIGFETKIFSNPVTKFISSVSFEIYLCHMMIYIIVEKVGLTRVFGESIASYLIACAVTTIGSIIFAIVYKKVEKEIISTIAKRRLY